MSSPFSFLGIACLLTAVIAREAACIYTRFRSAVAYSYIFVTPAPTYYPLHSHGIKFRISASLPQFLLLHLMAYKSRLVSFFFTISPLYSVR